MPADIRWLLLWLSAISGVAGDALGNWMQGSAMTLASFANSNQVRQKLTCTAVQLVMRQ